MAGSVKGIIIEIGGDTSGLQNALQKVNKATSSLSKELKGVNSLLKLDPKNTTLLSQKQELLGKEIEKTTKKLEMLRDNEADADALIVNMTAEQEKKYRNLQREIIATEQKLKEFKIQASEWTTISKKLDEIASKITTIGKGFSRAGSYLTTRVTAPIAAFATAGIMYNAQIESFETNLSTLLGSADKGAALLADLKKMASSTPFETQDLIKATQTMIGYGIAAEDAQEYLKVLGDISMGDSEKLSGLSLAFSQVQAAGKLTGQDLNQMINQGFNPLKYISEETGESISELKERMSDKDGGIYADEVAKAFKRATEEGQPFFKAMENGSKTVNGRISTLKDNFKSMTGELTENLLPTFEDLLGTFSKIIKKFSGLSKSQKDIITKFGLLAAALGPVLSISGKIVTGIGLLTKGLSLLSAKLAIASAEGGALSGVITALSGPIGIVIASIAALVAIFVTLYTKNENFRNEINKIWGEIVKTFQDSIEPIKENIMSIYETFKELWKDLEPFVMTIIGLVSTVFVGGFITAFDFLAGVLKNFGSNIQNIIETVKGVLEGIVQFVTGVFSGNWQQAWEGIAKIFTTVFDGIKQFLKDTINFIIDSLNSFIDGANKIKIPDNVPGIGGIGLNIPKIPRLATGGIVDKATLAMIGEGKSSEAVIPLDRTLTKYMAEAMRQAGGNQSVVMNFYPQQMTEGELDRAFKYVNKRFGMAF